MGELVRTARLALVVAAAWLIWQVFGDGFAWIVSASMWAAGVLVLLTVGLGVTMYVSPRFRRAFVRGTKRLLNRAIQPSARRR